MTKKTSTKLKMPRALVLKREHDEAPVARIDTNDSVGLPLDLLGTWVSVKEAKKLHAWLGRYFTWQEQKTK